MNGPIAKTILPLLLFLLFFFPAVVSPAAASPCPRAAALQSVAAADPRLEKIDATRISDDDALVRTIITQYEGERRVETAVFDVYVSGRDKSLAIARSYKSEGMKVLYVGENMWAHFPNTQRPIRITPVQRMLGEASHGDIARLSLSADYRVDEDVPENLDGLPCRKLLLSAVRKSAAYAKIVLYAQAGDLRPVKADLFLISGKQAKTAYYEEYRIRNGRPSLVRMTIRDLIEPAKRTVLEYTDIEPVVLPEKYFNKNYLVHFREPGK